MAKENVGWKSSLLVVMKVKLFILGAASGIIAIIFEDIFASDINDVGVCDYSEGSFEGDAICINMYCISGISIFVAIILGIVDVIFVIFWNRANEMAVYIANVNALIWSVLLAICWLISSSLVAELYVRYCDNDQNVCNSEVNRFIAVPVLGFISMLAWIINAALTAIFRIMIKNKDNTIV